jgi:hypothetical protein
MTVPVSQRSRGSVSVPAPDGYHYGDDHEWGAKEQTSLITTLKNARKKLEELTSEKAPRASANS